MTTGNDDNCKLPKDAVSKGDIEMKYGFVNGEARECGYTKLIYNNEDEMDKTTEIKVHPTGDHEITESNEKKKSIRLSALSGENRHYTAGGSAAQVDGNYDFNGESTSRFESAGDMAHATGKNKFDGIKGQHAYASAGKVDITNGSSALQSAGSSGTVRNSFEKDFFNHVMGDMAIMGEKNFIQVFQQDVAKYIGQNFDTYVKEKSKLEVVGAYSHVSGDTYSSSAKKNMTHKSDKTLTVNGKEEVVITSNTKITIKVGDNASISISDGLIEIKATKINVTATGELNANGHPLKINGGGSVSTPTQWS